MSVIAGWVGDIFIIILSLSFIELLLPDSNISKYVKFIFSLIIIATLLSPISYLSNK